MGWKEQVLHSGEGPIWATEWRGDLIAWANDQVSSASGFPAATEAESSLRESRSMIRPRRSG